MKSEDNKRTKYCFVYCGDEACGCGANEYKEEILSEIKPEIPVQGNWKQR